MTHERKDADVIGLTMIAALLLLIIAICILCVMGLVRLINNGQSARVAAGPQGSEQSGKFPPPGLQVNPESDLGKFRTATEATLNSYGWIDRKAGVAHIPIERAMQLTVERGLPEVGGGQTRLQLMQAQSEADSKPNEPVSP